MPGFPEKQHETHLPTLQSAPRAYPRLSGPHEDPWWPRRHQRPPRQGPQAPGRLSGPASVRKRSLRLPTVQRLKTRAQYEAAMAGGTVSRTPHFVLHRAAFEANIVPAGSTPGPAEGRGSKRSPVLFAVQDEPWMGVVV